MNFVRDRAPSVNAVSVTPVCAHIVTARVRLALAGNWRHHSKDKFMSALLVIKTGDALPAISAKRRDYETWIAAGAGLSLADVQVVRVFQGESLPDPETVPGVVITGSSAMVTDRAPWSETTAQWLERYVQAGKPVLGICYGHQLLAHALGGEVQVNPRGLEIGTTDVRLNPAARSDELFGRFAEVLHLPVCHVQAVTRLPLSATLLGGTTLDPNHVFRIGACAWGVQFHPEFDANIVRAYIDAKRDDMLRAGLDPEGTWHSATDTADGTFVLRRFAAIVRRRANPVRLAESAE
jgi:GMP synthase (glutamine-hydrolysing)